MVKGASRNAAGASSASSGANAAPQQLPSMQAGQVPTDPLTVLNGPMGHGIMNAGFNPFADMGLNTGDPNMVRNSIFMLSRRCDMDKVLTEWTDARHDGQPGVPTADEHTDAEPGVTRSDHQLEPPTPGDGAASTSVHAKRVLPSGDVRHLSFASLRIRN